MKKILLLMLLPVLLWSCGGDNEPTPPVVEVAKTLMTKYPNYESNKEARGEMIKEINEYGNTFVGKQPPFEGITFHFKRIITNEQTGAQSALLESFGALATVDNPNVKGRYLAGSVQICVLGIVPNDVALSLDRNIDYRVSGIVHAYDEDNHFLTTDWNISLYFGTYIIDNMVLEPITKE